MGWVKTRIAGVAAVGLLCAIGCPAAAQEALAEPPPPEAYAAPMVFKFLTAFSTGEVKLANGKSVNAANWPTVIATEILRPVREGQKTPICTGVFVGPNVVLMAAHCVDNPLTGQPRGAKVEIGPRKLDLQCEAPASYLDRDPRFSVPRGSDDYALCLMLDRKSPPVALARLRFEVVDAVAPPPKGARVLMIGYGCTEVKPLGSSLAFNERDGALRIADQVVDSPAPGGAGEAANWIGLASHGSEAMLCPGDSGGPLFTGATSDEPEGQTVLDDQGRKIVTPRRIRGVNSKVMPPRASDGAIVSNISALGVPAFADWAKTWLTKHGDHPEASKPLICGLNAAEAKAPCRS